MTNSCTQPVTIWTSPQNVPEDQAESEIHPLIQALLKARGIAPEDQKEFLAPRLASLSDPFEIHHMEAAIERTLQAIDQQERIVLYGDYDVDGVTSLAQVHQVLAAYGVHTPAFLPHRIDEGYGLSRAGLERCLQEHQPQLLIALDCGTVSHDEIGWLNDQGIDTIVIDHHQANHPLPDCEALVNPQLGDQPEHHIFCTAGLAFKFAHALLKTRDLPENHDFDLKAQLDLVALGTIADICPLKDENRLLVRHGLRQINSKTRPGVRALIESARSRTPLSANDISFFIAPRLNASGRLDSAQQSYQLLTTDTLAEAHLHALALDESNRQRQQLQREVHAEAQAQIELLDHNPPALILGARDWHPGVIGIVAGRIARDYNRPSFIIAFDDDGKGKGSGRSRSGISLIEGIRHCQEHIIQGGGHAAAAGISIQEDQFPDFREHFNQWMESQGNGQAPAPEHRPDFRLELHHLNPQLLHQWALLEPFGEQFSPPLFQLDNIKPRGKARWIKDRHLQFHIALADGSISAIWFNCADKLDHTIPDGPWQLMAELHINHYRGNKSLQLILRDIRTQPDH